MLYFAGWVLLEDCQENPAEVRFPRKINAARQCFRLGCPFAIYLIRKTLDIQHDRHARARVYKS